MQSRLDAGDIVMEARRWIGTPFRHQMARLGVGADCVGFVRGVAENLALVDLSADMRRELAAYSRTPNPTRMGELLATFLTRARFIDGAPDGYVAWLQWTRDLPMHLAITATFKERPTLIHALREHGVSEHGLTPTWRKRVHSYWRLPGVRYA